MPQPGDDATRLGAFLGELTAGRPAGEVHVEILRRLAQPHHDQRLSGVTIEPDVFAELFSALRNGLWVSEPAWESVVLPTIIAFGSEHTLKTNLELGTSLWLGSRVWQGTLAPARAVAAAPSPEPLAAEITMPEAVIGLRSAAEVHSGQPSRRSRVLRRILVPAAAAIALIAVIIAFSGGKIFQTGSNSPQTRGDLRVPEPPAVSLSVDASASATASATPAARKAKQPAPITSTPAPSPTWTGSGPATPPTPPRNLTATDITATGVTLTWEAPQTLGTGGISYYKLFRDGVSAGWTNALSVTIDNLSPSTSYVFTVIACSAAGPKSVPSDPVNVTTADLPATPTGEPSESPTEQLSTTP